MQGVVAGPPLRGSYGMAIIPLKEGAIPFTAKAFCMHCERAKVYKKVVQDCLDRGFIELPNPTKSQEWLVQGFVFSRKMLNSPGEESLTCVVPMS